MFGYKSDSNENILREALIVNSEGITYRTEYTECIEVSKYPNPKDYIVEHKNQSDSLNYLGKGFIYYLNGHANKFTEEYHFFYRTHKSRSRITY